MKSYIGCLLLLVNYFAPNSADQRGLGFLRKENVSMVGDSLPEKKFTIYLTFDDGPQLGTENCFNICKSLDIKATFFMVGEHVENSFQKGLVNKIARQYPLTLLANHSQTHAHGKYVKFYKSFHLAFEDFIEAQNNLRVPLPIIRLPGNSAWVFKDYFKASDLVKPVCKLLDSAGFSVIGWDLEWRFKRPSSYPLESACLFIDKTKEAILRCKSKNNYHLVILTHDRMFRKPNTADSLMKFINYFKKDPSIVFETIDHYPRIDYVAATNSLKKMQKQPPPQIHYNYYKIPFINNFNLFK